MPVKELDPASTALVLVDLQNGVLRLPVEPHGAGEVVRNCARLASAMRECSGLVVLVRTAFSPDGGDALRVHVDQEGHPTASPTTDYAELALDVRGPGDVIVTKKQWGAFYGTDLDLQLRRRQIVTVVLAGVGTCTGVESTARSAYERGYHVVCVEDAMSALTSDDHDFAFARIFPRIGRAASTDDVLSALGVGDC